MDSIEDDASTRDECDESLSDDQLTELRDMMQDLQVGFSAAMDELSKIQDEDRELQDKLESSNKHHDDQLAEILQTVQALKTQCKDMQYHISISNKNQRKLERQIQLLKSERIVPEIERQSLSSLGDFKPRSKSCHDKRVSPMLKPFIASLPTPEELIGSDDDISGSADRYADYQKSSPSIQRAFSHPANLNVVDSDGFSIPSTSNDCSTLDDMDRQGLAMHKTATGLRREKIVTRMVESERAYCTILHDLLELVDSKALHHLGVINTDHSKSIFPDCLKKMYAHHCMLLRMLEARLKKWHYQDVLGDVFGRFISHKQVDVFELYKEYITNFKRMRRNLRKMRKLDIGFNATVGKQNSTYQHATEGHDVILDHLQTPTKRMPVYDHFIQKLMRSTNVDHPDMFFLERSYEVFRSKLESITILIRGKSQRHDSDQPLTAHPRCLDTSSWSSHEEDQQFSTTTKDSGVHSNFDLGSHEELPTEGSSHQSTSFQTTVKSSQRLEPFREEELLERDILERPNSALDFTRSHDCHSMPRRCKTPNPGSQPYSTGPARLSKTRSAAISQSTPDLLDDGDSSDTFRRQKSKHKVQFKYPPEEHIIHKRGNKKRSIAETLRIFFNKRRGARGGNSGNATLPETTNSADYELVPPAPPEMFANDGLDGTTYEDENGDPYSIV